MTDLRAAAEMALDVLLNEYALGTEQNPSPYDTIKALEAALAQPKQEPVAWMDKNGLVTRALYKNDGTWTPLFTAPPSKPWVSLTDEEIDYIWGVTPPDYENFFEFPRAIEAALRSKNDSVG